MCSSVYTVHDRYILVLHMSVGSLGVGKTASETVGELSKFRVNLQTQGIWNVLGHGLGIVC